MSNEIEHKSGFVNIIGNPNVGKSTLMNALVGENLSIITSKVQTTRHRILGIVNGENFQLVYSDTPGIIETPNYKLQEAMMKFVDDAIEDADIFLFVTTVNEKNHPEAVIEKINKLNVPVIVVLNKIDLGNQDEVMQLIKYWESRFNANSVVIPVSALHKFNLEKLMQTILEKLPVSPPFYDKEELTDKSMRFFISEIIREKILLNFQKEIPYSCEISVEQYKESDDRIEIMANLYVLRDSQKSIILGKNGASIKRLGTDARKDIEAFVGKHVYLDLSVKVDKDWREKELSLKRFGYIN